MEVSDGFAVVVTAFVPVEVTVDDTVVVAVVVAVVN